MASICFNTIEAEKHDLPKPTSWWDLTKPEYKGHVVTPYPASSGTGFLDVSSWLQDFGVEAEVIINGVKRIFLCKEYSIFCTTEPLSYKKSA